MTQTAKIFVTQEVDSIVKRVAGDYESITLASMEEILCESLAISEEVLADALQGIRHHKPSLSKIIIESLSSIAYFLEDSSNAVVAKFSKRAIQLCSKTDVIENLLKEHDGNLEGVELCNSKGDLAVVFLKDASSIGEYRFSAFAADGFRYHVTRPTYEECLKVAIEDGFYNRCENKLNTFSQAPHFFDSLSHR